MPNQKYSIFDLIELVKNRPVIWDSTVPQNRNLMDKKSAWREVYSIMDKRYLTANSFNKAHMAKKMNNKWRNVKDIFIKTVRKQQIDPRVKNYMYHDELSFLLKILDTNPTRQKSQRKLASKTKQPAPPPSESSEESIGQTSASMWHSTSPMVKVEIEDGDMTENNRENSTLVSSSSVASNEEDATLLRLMKSSTKSNQQQTSDLSEKNVADTSCQQLNEDESFFASLLSSVKDMTETEKLEFRITVLQTIGNIKSKRNATQTFE